MELKWDFISYKLHDDVLAEAFAAGGITDVAFESSALGVRVVSGEDGLIFAKEGCELTLPQMLFLAWCGGRLDELDEEAMTIYRGMDCRTSNEGADLRSYRLETQYGGSTADKLRVISELFEKTDIANRLEYTVTRAAKGGMDTPFGVFGTERISYVGGRISYMLLVPAGVGSAEDNAALLMKDGELTISDRDGFEWQPEKLGRAMLLLNEVDAPKGMSVLKRISCKALETLILPPVVLEVCEGALTDCASLREVTILKRNIFLSAGFASDDVTLVGLAGSTAEEYAEKNGLGFKRLENVQFGPMEFAISDGVCLTADTAAVFRRQSNSRAILNDVSFTPYDGAVDDFDCEIIDISENDAASSGLNAQLEGFGSLIDTETVRNDRNGYIKATMMRSAERQDIFGYVLEIDHSGKVICLHTEKQFDDAALEKGAEKALFARYKGLGAGVAFGKASANVSPELPTFKVSEEVAAEPVVEEVAAEPEQMAEEQPVEAAVESVAEEAYTESTTIEDINEPVVEEAYTESTPAEDVNEPAAEEAYMEPTPAEDVNEPVAEEAYTEPAIMEEAVSAPEIDDHPLVEAEDLGEQESAPADEVIDVEPEDIRPADEPTPERLVRGARFDLSGYVDKVLTIDLAYQAEAGLDIDGYLFLLKEDGKVRSDADLIFFGQQASVDGAVKGQQANSRCFEVELSRLGGEISKLAVAYAIYGENPQQTFAGVSKPTVRISCNGGELCSYEIEGLSEEKSTVAVELYNKNGWKLRTVGLGYKEALKSLCGKYGVEVK